MIKTSPYPGLLTVLLNPALPGVIFLFGLTFCFAFVHIASLVWIPQITFIFYSILLVWTALIAWQRRELLKNFEIIDILFIMFFIVVLTSFALSQGKPDEAVNKYMCYLPFMMLAPYICGRLMRTPDIALLLRMTLLLGVIMLSVLAIDHLISPNWDGQRWYFFGQNHSPLLIGSLLATTLISLCAITLACAEDKRKNHFVQLIHYGFIAIVTITLVWMKARGWLIVGLFGVGIATSVAMNRKIKIRVGLFIYVVAIVVFTLSLLPRTEGQFYARILVPPTLEASIPAGVNTGGAILGQTSCEPLEAGMNSIEMRWVLYQEAVAIFMEHPFFGISAAKFSEQSCLASGGYPHSTILQSFAELGLVGGGLLLILFSFALVTLVRRSVPDRYYSGVFESRFVLALFSTFLLADQIYGNYFMSVGVYFMLGVSAKMQVKDIQEVVTYG